MSYGLIVRNDEQYAQIDSDTPRLCCLFEGTYAGNANITVDFPYAVTTLEPPCVFMRPDSSQAPHMMVGCVINGVPGSWVGFSMSFTNYSIWPRGTWFVAVFASRSESDYGLRLFGPSGEVVYDTGAPAVIFSSGTNYVSYVGTTNVGGTSYTTHQAQLPIPIGSNDHFMINPFSRGLLVNNASNNAILGATFDYVNNRVTLYSISDAAASVAFNIGSFGVVVARIKR